jgi:ribosomal protein S18 acetylase RimI-like enzyme
MAQVSPTNFQAFSLTDDPDGLWVAEDGGEMLGFAFSWMCGDLWFLAQLFVSPDRQGAGIGHELIQRTLNQADKAGAAKRALITFTFNRVSQGLYIRHDLFPRAPVYFFNIERERLNARTQSSELRCVEVDTSAGIDRLAAIDQAALGVTRAKHHRYLGSESGTRAMLLKEGPNDVGYFYLSSGGHIGPLAVTRADLIGRAFGAALHLAAQAESSKVSAFIPGSAEAALSLAVACGLRITFPMVLMATSNVGDWTQYLPRNPGFM